MGLWTRVIAVIWATIYGTVHLWWSMPPLRNLPQVSELLVPGRWTPAVLGFMSAAAILLLSLDKRSSSGPSSGSKSSDSKRLRWALTGVAWISGSALILGGGIFGPMMVELLFGWKIGDVPGFLARGSAVGIGILTVLIAHREQRRLRRACLRCGRVHGKPSLGRRDRAPVWAFAGGYLAIAGFVSRFAAEFLLGTHFDSLAILLEPFTIALMLAGVLLPLALVHRFGRIWPRWVLPFAGKNVPRWVVLVPAFAVSGGMLGYFGIGGMSALLGGNLGDAPLWWALMVIPFGYVTWGLGLGIAAISYLAMTKTVQREGRRLSERRSRAGIARRRRSECRCCIRDDGNAASVDAGRRESGVPLAGRS